VLLFDRMPPGSGGISPSTPFGFLRGGGADWFLLFDRMPPGSGGISSSIPFGSSFMSGIHAFGFDIWLSDSLVFSFRVLLFETEGLLHHSCFHHRASSRQDLTEQPFPRHSSQRQMEGYSGGGSWFPSTHILAHFLSTPRINSCIFACPAGCER